MYFEVFQDLPKSQLPECWHWRLNTGFGEYIMGSGSYATRSQCELAVWRVKQTTVKTEVLLT